MRFPHANKEEMGDDEFVARWAAWFAGKDSPGMLDPCARVPRLASAVGMQALFDQNYGHGLDALCRKIVRPPYRNTMQATKPFMEANTHILEHAEAKNPITGNMVQGAQLNCRGQALLLKVSGDERLMRDALAAVEADADIIGPRGLPTMLEPREPPATPKAHSRAPSQVTIGDRPTLIAALVDDIEREPFQPRYHLKPCGKPVTGWHDRLKAYFWPNPRNGFAETMAALAPLAERGRRLAQAPRPWDAPTAAEAMAFATDVLNWGGVPQRGVTPAIIDAVIQAALTGEVGTAPMNSGWTKVAAFATAHLEDERHANAIWDSRVSWSVLRRSDSLLVSGGWPEVPEVPAWLPHLGKVPGRGGTRWETPLLLHWPNGYARWEAHFAAAALVREIRDHLNRLEVKAPSPNGGTMAWTVRSIEMVLFMDGY
jgi:hypothetical protein